MVTLPNYQKSVKAGSTFGRLQIVGAVFRCYPPSGKNQKRRSFCVCECECGDRDVYELALLADGKTKSCGCLNRELCSARAATQGRLSVVHPVIAKAWRHMIDRCTNPKCCSFERYGKRGITVCDEWIGSLKAFVKWSLANGWASGLEIDRQDNEAGYSPENCRWVTRHVNMNNTRRTVNVSAFGETKSLAEWSRDARCVVSEETIRVRIRSGMESEKAISAIRGARC